jgi:hypothetical protein
VKLLDFEQGSVEWLQARAGKVTASRISDVLASIKSGEAAARRDYKAQLVAEILLGAPQDDGYINAEMQWGLDNEELARSAYEVHTGTLVDQVGLVLHPTIERAGASPDGLVGIAPLELKCPKTATHLQYLSRGKSLRSTSRNSCGKWPALVRPSVTSLPTIRVCQMTYSFSSFASQGTRPGSRRWSLR